MRSYVNRLVTGAVLFAALSGTVLATGLLSSASAQKEQSGPETTTAPPSGIRSAADVLAYIGRRAGVTVVADSSVAREQVPMPGDKAVIDAENVEKYIADVVKALPQGASWAKLHLPPLPEGRVWNGDDLVAYVRAQAKLYGVVGALPPPGKVEILSQKIPSEKAKDVITALNLKPVYVVTYGKGTFSGLWNSTFGEMHLKQVGNRVTGNYTFDDGVIEGTLINGVLRFRWLERGSGGWGVGYFRLADDGESLAGLWTSGEDLTSANSEWTGKRVSRR